VPNELQSYWLMACSWLIVFATTGTLALLVYWLWVKQPLRQPRANLIVRWDGVMVGVGVLLCLAIPGIVHQMLASSGFFTALYGPDFPITIPKDQEINPEIREATNLRGLWATLFADPIVIALILLSLRYFYQVQAGQLGFARSRLPLHLVVGWLRWAIFTPIVFAVYFLAIVLIVDQPEQHHLTQLGPRAHALEWAMFDLVVVVLAPCLEEFLFRGVLLFWLLKRPGGTGDNVLEAAPKLRATGCLVVAGILSLPPVLGAMAEHFQGPKLLRALAPMLFVVAIIPLYVWLPLSHWLRRRTRLRSAHEVRAILASSIVFAAVHNGVWPSPIPLFVLGAGLGYVTVRTRSLVPAIVIHSLFNAVSAVFLLLGGK
jgi:membrane protease YdiL (CAAX protease family)